MVFDNCNSR